MGNTPSTPLPPGGVSGTIPAPTPTPGTATTSKAAAAAPEEGESACPLGFGGGGGRAPGMGASADAGGGRDKRGVTEGSTADRCPVRGGDMKNKKAKESGNENGHAPQAQEERESKCPVKQTKGAVNKYLNPHSYDVYGRRIVKSRDDRHQETDNNRAAAAGAAGALDPNNNMPANANQLPAPGQKQPLSTDRVQSTIPKGGTESTWSYPSPQMFWNALSRKGKVDNTEESDIDVVVAIHNNMNENTWKEILKWEDIRWDVPDVMGAEPRLLRFLGRPDDTSPKATVKMLFGHPLPFDRHDWIIDRGGKERRYVIDYYHDEEASSEDQTPDLHSREAIKSIKIDVRPAVDDVISVVDRFIKMPLKRSTGASDFVPLPFFPSPSLKKSQRPIAPQLRAVRPASSALVHEQQPDQRIRRKLGRGKKKKRKSEGEKQETLLEGGGGGREMDVDPEDEAELRRVLVRIRKECSGKMLALREFSAEEGQHAEDSARAQALALSLEHCTARVACPTQATAYSGALGHLTVLENDRADTYFAEHALDRRIDGMRACLGALTERQMAVVQRKQAQRSGGEGEGGGRREYGEQ